VHRSSICFEEKITLILVALKRKVIISKYWWFPQMHVAFLYLVIKTITEMKKKSQVSAVLPYYLGSNAYKITHTYFVYGLHMFFMLMCLGILGLHR